MLRSILFLATICCITGISPSFAQANDKEQKAAAEASAMKSLVESQRYMFVAQTMLPQSGRARAITNPIRSANKTGYFERGPAICWKGLFNRIWKF